MMDKNFKRPMIILFIVQFLVMVGFGIVIPILPYLMENLGGGALSLGVFMSAYSIMQFFFAPLWGRLSDRIGRRPVLLIGLSGYGMTFLLFGIANNIPLLIAIRAVSGMISSATLPTAMAYLADITEGVDRSKSMGMVGAAMGLGMIFGPAIGGWLGEFSFTLPFFVAGGLALSVLPFAWAFLPETLKQPTKGPSQRGKRLSWAVFQDPLFALFAVNFALSFSIAMFESTFALLAAVKVGFGPKEMGMTFVVVGIVSSIIQGGLIGKLVKHFGDSKLVKFGMVISALGFISILLSPNTILLVLATTLLMTGTALMNPTSSSLVTRQSTHGQGVSLGFFQSFGSLGRIFGPIVGGALYGVNIELPYIVGAILLIFMFVITRRNLSKYGQTAV